ncbi:MAG: enoyl-CoA hydratase/isomerase family protein [Deltaproteobacteria bacterium]|nr:enoyl-CoA hydratase/isomerase family protein [Deltaproteobacteria bacterium]
MTSIARDGDVAMVRLEEPRANALSRATITALSKALYQLEQSDAKALVLTGKGRVFGAGLDLVEASAFDRPALADYVDAFEALFLQLFIFRLPVVAAVNGHALAGGAVLALACDERVLPSHDDAELGLIEVELGLPLPSAALEVARFAVPPERWTEAIALGRRYRPGEALVAGIAQQRADDVVAAATARARAIAALGPGAVQQVKRELRHDALTRARMRAVESRRLFVDAWMSDEAKRRIGAIVARLTGN